ncbi:MAG: hypothetical protein GWN00_15865, partial [Aliifodinibius sp.]|nr:hypothetical protein [candidate division Zixibacteria bacterium]NIT57644.1 hypothetical protein [Fodinibius sp.]NIW45330.1 hypothetical protein [Gammaproteobacteria bacterium]NIS46372.1 hypothetical protein [candidate division Zixibacteria bacterium]NIU14459.1 hypothetical protein [candidate division Zixibacteria bacterium]
DSIDEIIFTTFGEDPNPYSGGSVYAVDINGNNLPGWPKQVNAPIPGTAVVGNINNDSIPDLIVGSWTTLYAWDATGTALPNFPKFIGANVSPAIFDIDRDGELEIIYPTDGTQMFVYNADGTALPGWPVFAPESIGSPAIADIDQDNEYEIVAGTYQGPVGPDPFEIYAWNLDGSVVSGFPVPTSGVVKAAPAVGDLDNDGGVEIIAISYHTSNQDSLYVWDGQGNLKPGWPQPVAYGRLSSPSLGDLDLDGDLEIVIGGWAAPPTSMEQLFAFHHDGSPVANWPVMLNHPGNSGNINNSPVIADIDGDTTTMEVLVKAVDHVFALHGDGTVVTGYPQFIDDQGHSGTFSPSPAVGDMDNDGDVELI